MKRRASIASSQLPVSDGSNLVQITPLGAGQEVGRSCIILKYQGRSVMFDCGIHPGYSGVNSLPYLDGNEDVDISTVDVALITHFHLDHCAAVPYLLSKTRFKGRVFMTHPTKAIYHSLLKDFARGGKGSADEGLYGEAELDASMERIEVVDFLQTLEVAGGIKVTPFRAGHVLGAAMFMVEIAGMRCLYTGDYSRVPDRHLPGADTPHIQPDIVIVESTYGVSRHLPREQREELFLQRVVDTLRGGGRVLLPVVAMGRSQELLLLLDEYWEAHPELAAVPIYQASGQMRKGMRVYETYVEMMNDDIKAVFQHHNPFAFRHVTHLKSAAHFDDVGPCVLMATPSGLQSGASRDAFEAWCEDKRNTVIICDFAVQGTLAREILGGPKDILTRTGYRKTLRCGVAHISFSAHADYDQTSGFLDEVRPPHVVLVHGEKTEMGRLKVALDKRAQELGIPLTLYTPAVMQSVQGGRPPAAAAAPRRPAPLHQAA
ncbi:beta-lactamase-like protein [Haematococcus lacustris]